MKPKRFIVLQNKKKIMLMNYVIIFSYHLEVPLHEVC